MVSPDALTLVVVGEAETLADPLRAAGFANLQVVTDQPATPGGTEQPATPAE